MRSGELVAPFKSSADPARAYFAILSKNAAGRPEVNAFVEWLKEEAGKR
jgi:DNA-binding transcriptional LysR family regulator